MSVEVELIYAPWTDEQVKNLNAWQKDETVHPFTCGGDRGDKAHKDGEGVLVATRKGWKCPYCPYTQIWAHAFMGIVRPITPEGIRSEIDEVATADDNHTKRIRND